jgi:hypothetical protein
MPGRASTSASTTFSLRASAGMSSAAGAASLPGIENAVPSGSTPCAEFRLSFPSASAASSTESETKPQP